MRRATRLELDFQKSLWDLLHTIKNRLPLIEGQSQNLLVATIHDLETLRGCAEILSFAELATICDRMSAFALAGLQGEHSASLVSLNLQIQIDESLSLLCST